MAKLILKNLNKTYHHDVKAVKNVNLVVEKNEFLVLVGPSGCGKSTILRMIAGLEEITQGEIFIDDVKVNDISPKDRNIAMVFQNYALYPHMNVYDNLAFALKMRKMPKTDIAKKIKEVAAILEIENLLQRKPKQLSGGQRQRVALGRAIIREPRIFLMDEPLSNLDAKLRGQMRAEICRLYKKLNTTMIYVTHDQTEAMTMGTSIVVLKDGVIQQADNPSNIYQRPVNTFVAGFIGTPPMNLLHAKVVEAGDGCAAQFRQGLMILSAEDSQILKSGGYINKEIILGIRSEDIQIADENPQMQSVCGEVDVIENLGSELYVHFNTENGELLTRVHPENPVLPGERKFLTFHLNKMHLFDKESGERID